MWYMQTYHGGRLNLPVDGPGGGHLVDFDEAMNSFPVNRKAKTF